MARTTWTVDEYCAQGEEYFSESAQEFVKVDEMAPQYALNAYRKLLKEFGCSFASTELGIALGGKVAPGTDGLRVMLDAHGRARVLTSGLTTSGARARLRRAGASRTHKEGEWIVGEKDSGLAVSVRKVKR